MNKKKYYLLNVMIVILIHLEAMAQDEKFYIFLAFGQSNMEGYAKIRAEDTLQTDSRFQVMAAVDCAGLNRTKGHWYTAVPPLCRCNTGLTLTDFFGRKMIANLPADVKVGIINVSVGGCRIDMFDKNNYQPYLANTPDWLKRIAAQYDGKPYDRLIEMAKLAQNDGVIKGILLHQGESNMGDTAWPQKVKTVYHNMLTDLHLEAEKVPLLAGEAVDAEQGGICAAVNKIIARLPSIVSTAHIISSKGCTDGTDNLHFDAEGYKELGKRYASVMLTLLGYPLSQ